MGAVETGLQEQGLEENETSIDRDNKLLSFNHPTCSFELLNWSLQRTSLFLEAQLHGMFFIAETPQGSNLDMSAPSADLTCYRRNLFQITGSIRLPRALRYIVTDYGVRIPIEGQEFTISATESGENAAVKVISVPWKTPPVNASSTPEDRAEKEPASISLDITSSPDIDPDYATFPIGLKRLQFRTATNNNGRRKELQQHYVIRLKVIATLAEGMGKVPICEATSGPILVRGRSPKNFERHNELPVGNASKNSRRTSNLSRGSTQENVNAKPASRKGEKTPNPSSKSSTSNAPKLGPAPLKLSLAVDGDTPGRSFKSPRTSTNGFGDRPTLIKQPSAPASARLSSARPHNPDGGLNTIGPLYEHIPLGMEDWMPPVDAIYRPHVVHHLQNGTGSAKAQPGMSGRSKRYFSEDQS